jgi:hypothetical protein
MTGRTILFIIFIAMPINAAVAASCPAFTAGMVDAAMMATDYSQPEPVTGIALDSPSEPRLFCEFLNNEPGYFLIFVGDGEATVEGNSPSLDRPEFATVMRTRVLNLSRAEQIACRKEVLKSFVWNQYCKPLME